MVFKIRSVKREMKKYSKMLAEKNFHIFEEEEEDGIEYYIDVPNLEKLLEIEAIVDNFIIINNEDLTILIYDDYIEQM